MSKDKKIISPDTEREERVPPGQELTKGWPVLHHGLVPEVGNLDNWRFKIIGLVEEEKELTYEEFNALPEVEVFSDIHCVTHWSKLDCLWRGVSTGELKNIVKIKPEARFVMVHAMGDFTTNLPIEEFFDPDCLFTKTLNDEEITEEHGWPLRLVVPRLYFWKSAKWVTGIEFMAEDRKGFWEENGYHNHGDPWNNERFDW